LLAILFGFLVFQFFTRQGNYYAGETTSVLFAAEDIPSGTFLINELLEVKLVPRQVLPANYLNIPEQAVGQQVLYSLVKGEIILPGKLASGQGSVLAQRCPPRKWCIRIPEAWFLAAPMDLAEGDRIEIASALPGSPLEKAGFIATQVQVIDLPGSGENPGYVLAVDDQEALSILYARVNEFQMLVLLRPEGG
ncbi:MAG: SAF domain-containing protein, partial [Anaerolineales bacterium]